MRQFFIITWWEFFRHFKSKSFVLATFISPILFALIILIPTLFLNNPASDEPHLVGCVEFDTTRIAQKIRERFNEINVNRKDQTNIKLVTIRSDTSDYLANRFEEQILLKSELDSLNDAYNKIKERRKYIFQKPKTPKRERLLKRTYQELIQTRESRDLIQLDYIRTKATNDSLWRRELIRKADEMLRKQELEGFLLIDTAAFSKGIVEFHSFLPAGFLQIDPIRQAVQVVAVEERLKKEGIWGGKIQEWLEPVKIKEIQLQAGEKKEFNFMVNYLGPIIVVFFLFISIFTSSGFLFNGVLKEKTNRVLEILLSSVNHTQLISAKIVGLGILGIFQIIIWFGITLILIGLNVLNVGEVGFLSIQNGGLFLLYFVLGYLFFASIFVGVGSLFSSQDDAHHLNQFMRMLSIFPIVLAVLVLESPNAMVVRILSFIPPLTPTFMILRTPLGNPPLIDYYISIGVMVLSIIIGIFMAGRLFRVGSLLYGKKPTLRNIFRFVFSRY